MNFVKTAHMTVALIWNDQPFKRLHSSQFFSRN